MIFPKLAAAPTPTGGPTQIRAPFRTLYLPNVWGPPLVMPPANAYALYELMANDPHQKRSVLLWNSRLADVAQTKARDLLEAQVFGHDLDGMTPNELLRFSGFTLPLSYPKVGNSVESLVTNTDSPAAAWLALKSSPPHKEHVLGWGPFFSKQNVIGIGWHKIAEYDPDSDKLWVMGVILTLHP